ncbi:hypothetical protein H5A33_15025 [Pectobacterium brasiliense]|uniref:type II toxin-antitoxin system Phd/YefM family antitoxin n=1 Tax=Pectobacterium brasiliense TaxID=180957 RepID=UPI00196932FF|nr:hypothetical protein [Pectobacterium brasiliense]MBN3255935.1 hypothetical protein [Pectobacterium brasiliense]UDQ75848.1 hypothetical protein LJQ72_20435 [Pectobacterium brasiliense]WJM82875.1 hypothetical protein QTI90_09070 [Pectobacterium brasiliense]
MEKVNHHEGKPHFSKIINRVSQASEDYLIAHSTIVPPPVIEQVPRIGFMRGQVSAPDNFNDLNKEEIIDMFNGKL